MKKIAGLLFLALFAYGRVYVLAGEGETPGSGAPAGGRGIYVFTADAEAESALNDLELEMENRFNVYNRLFRFDPSLLSAPLNVRVFGNKEAYDSYVIERLGEPKPGSIYLHYSQTGRRELVIHSGPEEFAKEASMIALAHQAFVQYLRAFVANPPSWLRDGFAIYYSTLRSSFRGSLEYEKNLIWLEALRNLGENMPSPEAVFLADEEGSLPLSQESIDAYKISSWALVSFLLSGSREYYRDLVECFMLLTPNASAAANTLALKNHFLPRLDIDVFEKDLRSYLDSLKTYRELMEKGHEAYSRGDFLNAELSFLAAMDQRPLDYAPCYYLGLLSFEGKSHDMAERYYLESREKGADEALVSYALGINAAAAGRDQDAVDFLHTAASKDPPRFRALVEEQLKRIWR